MSHDRIRFYIGPGLEGGHTFELTRAKDRQLTMRLTEPSEVSFSINGEDPAIDPHGNGDLELREDIHVTWEEDNGSQTEIFRGRVGGTTDSLEATTHTVGVTAHDYREVLNRRRLYSTDQLTYTTADQAFIAWNMINITQTKTGGNMGITRGTGQTTGKTRDRTYLAGDSIGERIQELSEVLDGFDWDIEPSGPSALEFNIYYPQRGQNNNVTLEWGGEAVQTLERTVDPADFANALRLTGKDDGIFAEREGGGLADNPTGRWDGIFTSNIKLQTTLDERAEWLLDKHRAIVPSYSIQLREGFWRGKNHIWVGDTVRVVIPSGRLKTNIELRVYEIDFSITDDGVTEITLIVGAPKLTIRQVIPKMLRWLNRLERK